MKIRILSDLHLEFQDWNPPHAEAGVIVLAGDIHSGTRGVEWARRQFPVTPVLYVPGNHEFYGRDIEETLSDLHAYSRGSREPILGWILSTKMSTAFQSIQTC